jgi:hypothetical protein
MAARYLEGRIVDARMHAVKRAARVGLRFVADPDDYQIGEYVDGNANGLRTAEIVAGVDFEIAPPRRIGQHFPGVRFGLRAHVPDLDGIRASADGDGVRIGTSRILSMGPDGTATAGTLYLRGRREPVCGQGARGHGPHAGAALRRGHGHMGDTLSDRRGETRLTGVSLPVSHATLRPGTPAFTSST